VGGEKGKKKTSQDLLQGGGRPGRPKKLSIIGGGGGEAPRDKKRNCHKGDLINRLRKRGKKQIVHQHSLDQFTICQRRGREKKDEVKIKGKGKHVTTKKKGAQMFTRGERKKFLSPGGGGKEDVGSGAEELRREERARQALFKEGGKGKGIRSRTPL